MTADRFAFTRGPWRFWEHKQIQTRSGGPLTDMWGVCIPADGGNCVNASSRADCLLIASAPDLIAALEVIKAEASIGNGERADRIHRIADEAIRVATGART